MAFHSSTWVNKEAGSLKSKKKIFLISFQEQDESANTILSWIFKQLDGDEIEDVTDEILDKLVKGDLDGVGTIYCKCRSVSNLAWLLFRHVLFFFQLSTRMLVFFSVSFLRLFAHTSNR